MAPEHLPVDKTKTIFHPESIPYEKSEDREDGSNTPLMDLQRQIGNRAVQRLIIQRNGEEPAEIEKDVEDRINHERTLGQPLDSQVQAQMESTTGQDLSGVQVHTSEESDTVNRQLGARAFTSGNDIFFTHGSYQPGSSEGQQLLAHELTHVIQQRSGIGSGNSGRLTVNAPGDPFEQEADEVAQTLLQRDGGSEDEEEEKQ